MKQLIPLYPQSEGTRGSLHATRCSAPSPHLFSPASPLGDAAHSGWVFPHQLIIKITPTHTEIYLEIHLLMIQTLVKFTVNSTRNRDTDTDTHMHTHACTHTHRYRHAHIHIDAHTHSTHTHRCTRTHAARPHNHPDSEQQEDT